GLNVNTGEEHAELGPLLHLTVDLDPAAMLLDDSIGRRQAEPGPLADVLGREERLENMREMLGCDPSAVITHPQASPAGGGRISGGVRTQPLVRRGIDRKTS